MSSLSKTVVFGVSTMLAFGPAFVFGKSLETRIDEQITSYALTAVIYGAILLAVLLFISFRIQPTERSTAKRVVFTLIVIVVGAVTLFMALSTVYLNRISASHGPVHWHADFIISHCGQDLDLINPQGLSNKIGTPVLHEHADNRIHVEGVVVEPSHASVASFFEVIGGSAGPGQMVIPTESGLISVKDGQKCPNGRAGRWQVFVYTTDVATSIVSQRKLDDYPSYILSPYSLVPPGDCLVFEFTDEVKEKTDRLCNFYQIELEKGSIRFSE